MLTAITAPTQLKRSAISLLALIGTAGSTWINPPPASDFPASGAAPPRIAALPSSSSEPVSSSPVEVVQWGFADSLPAAQARQSSVAAMSGRPLYLWMTLDGAQAALDRLQSQGPVAIEVHWTREDAGTNPRAPGLVTGLTVGSQALAPTLAAQVRRDGHFEWHSWARKDALSPGTWTVSLTYPDGQPVLCAGAETQPCRLSIDVGQPTG